MTASETLALGSSALSELDEIVRQIDPADLRRNVGYVSQDTTLFFGSVKENISFGVRNVDDAMIVRAASA